MDEKKLQYISEPAHEIAIGALEESNRRLSILCASSIAALIGMILLHGGRKDETDS